MLQEEILKAEGQKVKKVLAWDHVGYDRGFTLEFESGLTLDVSPTLVQGPDVRLTIEEGK